jgi:protein phosphatase
MKQLHFGCATHTGLVRQRNEDCYGMDEQQRLWLVADGLGGHDAGDVASQIAVESILDRVRGGADLEEAMASAHQAILDAAEHGIGRPEMGTTAVALIINDRDYEIAWVGDSRAYLWADGKLVQMSRDHTVVQELVDQGFIPREHLKNHPYGNILNRTLGVTQDRQLNVERIRGALKGNEIFLLCSDGLTNELDDEVIQEVLNGSGDEQAKVDQLVELALCSGGSDNITAILVNTTSFFNGRGLPE